MRMRSCGCKRITAPGRRVYSPASLRRRMSTAGRGVGFTILSGIGTTACCMADMTRAFAPAILGAQAYWLLGQPDTGLALGREALALAERIAHPFSLGTALVMNAMLHLDRDEPEAAVQRIEAAEALAAEQRLGLAIEPEILRGAVMTAQGASAKAVASLREALTRPRAPRLRPYGLARLGEALAQQGEYGAALAALREGLADQERTGQRRWEAELHRLEGLALLGLNRLEEAHTALEEALAVARRQQA